MAKRVTFRPTLRTGLLLAAAVIVGLLGVWLLSRGGRVLADRAVAVAPPEATPLQVRAMRQLRARSGQETNLMYSTPRRGPNGEAILCGYASPSPPLRPVPDPARPAPARVYAFISLPDRAITSRDAGFERNLAAMCQGMPGAPAPPPP